MSRRKWIANVALLMALGCVWYGAPAAHAQPEEQPPPVEREELEEKTLKNVWIWTWTRLPEKYAKNKCLIEAAKLAEAMAKSKKGRAAFAKVNKPGVDFDKELKDATGPELEVKEIKGNPWGAYEGDSGGKEDAIYLDQSTLDATLKLCENAKTRKAAIVRIASQILHETAHWKDDVKKHPDDDTNTPGEEGTQLEKDIFGGNIDMGPLDKDGHPTDKSKLTKDGKPVPDKQVNKWADPKNWK